MLDTKINPVSVFPDTAVSLRVIGAQVRKPGTGGQAIVAWQLLTEKGETVKSGGLPMVGKDYDAWGEDDSYLSTFVLSKLGLTAAGQ